MSKRDQWNRAAAVREAMRRAGLRECELVQRTGLEQSYINNVLNGVKVPRRRRALRIATALGCRVREAFPVLASTRLGLGSVYVDTTTGAVVATPEVFQ